MKAVSDVAVSVPSGAAAKDRLFGVYSGGLELRLTATAGRRFRKRHGIRYLFLERVTPEQMQLIGQAVQAGALEKIEEFLYALQ